MEYEHPQKLMISKIGKAIQETHEVLLSVRYYNEMGDKIECQRFAERVHENMELLRTFRNVLVGEHIDMNAKHELASSSNARYKPGPIAVVAIRDGSSKVERSHLPIAVVQNFSRAVDATHPMVQSLLEYSRTGDQAECAKFALRVQDSLDKLTSEADALCSALLPTHVPCDYTLPLPPVQQAPSINFPGQPPASSNSPEEMVVVRSAPFKLELKSAFPYRVLYPPDTSALPEGEGPFDKESDPTLNCDEMHSRLPRGLLASANTRLNPDTEEFLPASQRAESDSERKAQ